MERSLPSFISVTFRINGETTCVAVPPNMTLLEVLRNHLRMTGTKEGCGTGECGACTVLINGRPALACLTLACAVEGKEILTIEGSAAGGKVLHTLQHAFLDTGAVQCGFCTPGMIMSSLALLLKNPKPSAEEIREAVSGNTCRCTGYHKVVQAVEKASQQLAEEGK